LGSSLLAEAFESEVFGRSAAFGASFLFLGAFFESFLSPFLGFSSTCGWSLA